MTAGVFAFGAVGAGAAVAGMLFLWFGWHVVPRAPVHGFHPSLLLVEAVWIVLAARCAASASRRSSSSSRVRCGCSSSNLISDGGGWSTVVSLLVGLAFLVAAVRLDRGGTLEWVLAALFSAGYVLLASPLERSSWAVVGTIGLFVAAEHLGPLDPRGGVLLPRRRHPAVGAAARVRVPRRAARRAGAR